MAAFYRKDSSLSNDVFESVDVAPPGVLNGDEAVARPETVPEETSSLTNSTSVEPTADLPTEYDDEPSQHISTLPVKTGVHCFSLRIFLLSADFYVFHENPYRYFCHGLYR